jgi:AcrR family transcriptional regulator
MKPSPPAHEGTKIRDCLARAGRRPADLARACGVSPTAVTRHLTAARLGAKAWETVSRGLAALGIDPRQVRAPAPPPLSLVAREGPEDLRPLVEGWSRRHLEAVVKILEASLEAQFVLKVVLRDRLERG